MLTEHKFYVVATPIGNLKDITFRAIEILNSVDEILCEDTRKTIGLLNHYNIKKKLNCYTDFNSEKVSSSIIQNIKSGKIYALVSDAGTPAISDPGFLLIKQLISENINIITIPGASSITAAVAASGLCADRFLFFGFLSNNSKKTEQIFNEFSNIDATLIFLESPKRIIKTLKIALSVFGDKQIVIGRELTKLYEQFIRGKINEIIENETLILKGEMIVLIDNHKQQNKENQDFIIDQSVKKLYNNLLNYGLNKNAALKITADTFDLHKNKLYDFFTLK